MVGFKVQFALATAAPAFVQLATAYDTQFGLGMNQPMIFRCNGCKEKSWEKCTVCNENCEDCCRQGCDNDGVPAYLFDDAASPSSEIVYEREDAFDFGDLNFEDLKEAEKTAMIRDDTSDIGSSWKAQEEDLYNWMKSNSEYMIEIMQPWMSFGWKEELTMEAFYVIKEQITSKSGKGSLLSEPSFYNVCERYRECSRQIIAEMQKRDQDVRPTSRA